MVTLAPDRGHVRSPSGKTQRETKGKSTPTPSCALDISDWMALHTPPGAPEKLVGPSWAGLPKCHLFPERTGPQVGPQVESSGHHASVGARPAQA